MAKWEDAPLIDTTPEWSKAPIVPEAPREGTWPGEVYRAASRVARQVAATVPGTLATLMQAGENAPGGWYIRTPEVAASQERAKRVLRRTAELTYRSADAPELAPRKGGVGGFVVNAGASALGYMGGTAAATAVGGPAGALAFGTAAGGEMMYQEAMKDMASRTDLTPEQKESRAETERILFGPIYGLIERLQVGKALKVGEAGIKPIIAAARQRAWKKVAQLGGKFTREQLVDAAWEGTEEALQEMTQIGAATLHGRMPQKSDVRRVAMAFGGGAVAGGVLKAGKSAVDALAKETPAMPYETPYAAPVDTSSATADTNMRVEDVPALTKADAEQLQASGFSQEEIASMTPEDARGLLATPVVPQKPPVGATQETSPVADAAQVAANGGGKPPAPPEPAAATITEPPSDERPFTIRNAAVADRADEMGLMPLRAETPETRAQWMAEALAKDIPGKAEFIAQEIIDNPRPLTGPESMGFQVALDAAYGQWKQASEKLRTMKNTDSGYGALRAEAGTARSRYYKLFQASKAGGRKAAQSLGVRAAHPIEDDTNELSVLARAQDAKGDQLTPEQETQFTQDVENLRNAEAQSEDAKRQLVAEELGLPVKPPEPKAARRTKRKANRVLRGQGLKRYARMSEADKDAELQELLQTAGDSPTDRDLLNIAMNIGSRPGVNNVADVSARMLQYFPDVGMDRLASIIANTTSRGPRRAAEVVRKLYEMRQEGRTNDHISLVTRDLIYYLESGGVPDKLSRTVKTPTEATAALREIRDYYRQQLMRSEPVQRAKLEKDIAVLEARIEARDFFPQPKEAIPVPESLTPLVEKRRSLRAYLSRARGKSPERYAVMTEAEKDAEIQRLLTQEPSANTIARMAENIASRPEVTTFEEVVNRVGTLVPGTDQNTIIDAVAAAKVQQVQNTAGMVVRLREILKGPARKNKTLEKQTKELLGWLERGEVPPKIAREPRPEAAMNAKLIEVRNMLRTLLKDSPQAVQARLNDTIANLTTRIDNGDYAPRHRRVRPTYEKEFWRKREEVAKLRSIIYHRFDMVRPRTTWQKAGRTIKNLFRFQMAMKGSFDDSALGNQGRWMLLSHPLRTIKAVPWTVGAIKSDAEALRMQAELDNRPNAWIYHSNKGFMLPVAGNELFTQGIEQFRSDWVDRIPGLRVPSKASARWFAMTMNRMRADAIDAWVAAEYGPEGPPMEHVPFITGMIKTATGQGELAAMNKYVEAANGFLWAPRKKMSDVLLVIGQPLIKKQPWVVRRRVIKEYVRAALGAYIAAQLLSLAWGPPEEDKRSSLWGQWKIPGTNTYVSPLGPWPRIVALMNQIWTGERKTKAGRIVPIRGPERPFGAPSGLDLLTQWVTNSLAPGPRFVSDAFLTGEDFAGNEVTFASALADSITPISGEDVYDIMREEMDVEDEVAASAMAFFGASVNVHEQQARTSAGRRRIRRRKL